MNLSLVPPRSYRPEILDAPGNRYEDLAPALRDISRVNRWLGGSSAVVRTIVRLAAREGLREFSLLDVGTGGGDVPRAVMAAGSRRRIAVRAAGLDLDPHIVRFAADRARHDAESRPTAHPIQAGTALPTPSPYTRSSSLTGGRFPDSVPDANPSDTSSSRLALVRGDGFSLPFPDRGIDFVTCSLFLHHFREAEASRLVAEFARVARRAVVVNDLARHLVPWAAIRVLAGLFAESPMFQHDAPLSVLRGWTARELLAVAEGAGLRDEARVRRFAPYRIVLCIERTAAP